MVSERLRQMLLKPAKAVPRRRPRLSTRPSTPVTVIKGLRMGPTGCVCRVSLFGLANSPSAAAPSTSPTGAPMQPLREELVVLPELAPRVVVHATAEDFEGILQSRQLPARRRATSVRHRTQSDSSSRRAVPRLHDGVPHLPCPLAAKQLCRRCPWMSVSHQLSVDIKTQQFRSQLRAALPQYLPYLCGPFATLRGHTRAQDGDADASQRLPDVTVQTDSSSVDAGENASGRRAHPAAVAPEGLDGQLQRLPVEFRQGVPLLLQGNHLQEVYFTFEGLAPASSPQGHANVITPAPPSAPTPSFTGGAFHFVRLSAEDSGSLAPSRASGGPAAAASRTALRELCRTNSESGQTNHSVATVDDGVGFCALATLEQKRLLPLLNQWSSRLPLATQACLRGALVLQVPSSTRARQAWSTSLLVTVLMEKDVVGWGPQSPLCGPAHPADILSVMEQELVEAVLAAAPLLPCVRVQVGFLAHVGQTDSAGWAGARESSDGDVMMGDLLHPEVRRRTPLTHSPMIRDHAVDDHEEVSLAVGKSSAVAEPSSLPDHKERNTARQRDERGIASASDATVAYPLACYIDAADQVVESTLHVTAAALEAYTLNVCLSKKPSPVRERPSRSRRSKAAPSPVQALLPIAFFRHVTSLDTTCSVLLSALLEPPHTAVRRGIATRAPPPPSSQIWLQLGEWRTHSALAASATAPPSLAAMIGVSDARVATKRLGDALVSVLDVLTKPEDEREATPLNAVVACARRWHRHEGRELPLHETENSDGVAPIIARRRAVPSSANAHEDANGATRPQRFALLSVLTSDVELARTEALSVIKWIDFVQATLLHAGQSGAEPLARSPVRVVLAVCASDGASAPLLAALEVVCQQSGIGLPLDDTHRLASRRLRLDRLCTSVIDVDPLAASSVLYASLELSLR